MADVFISYKREERARVERIARALQELGLSVWFDASLEGGGSFSAQINREVRTAKCVLVCWTPAAAHSEWVIGEADIGRTRGVLAPVLLAPTDLPPPFNMLHAFDLMRWNGDHSDVGWLALMDRIESLRGAPRLNAFAVGGSHAVAANAAMPSVGLPPSERRISAFDSPYSESELVKRFGAELGKYLQSGLRITRDNRDPTEVVQFPGGQNNSTLELKRADQLSIGAKPVLVFVDGWLASVSRRGRTLRASLPAGKHELRIAMPEQFGRHRLVPSEALSFETSASRASALTYKFQTNWNGWPKIDFLQGAEERIATIDWESAWVSQFRNS